MMSSQERALEEREQRRRYERGLTGYLYYEKDMDKYMSGSLAGMPPDPEVWQAKLILLLKARFTHSKKMRKVCYECIDILNRQLSMHRKIPVVLDTLLKGSATESDEVDVIT
jgi:hypothetical protein